MHHRKISKISFRKCTLVAVLGRRKSGGGIGNKIEIPFFHTFLENEWSGRSERRPISTSAASHCAGVAAAL